MPFLLALKFTKFWLYLEKRFLFCLLLCQSLVYKFLCKQNKEKVHVQLAKTAVDVRVNIFRFLIVDDQLAKGI